MDSSAQETASHLALRLRRAGGSELLRLVNDHAGRLELRQVRLILLNPHCNSEVIEELACNRRLLTDNEIRRAVARHRRTPQAVAMRFIPGLFWRDLLEISVELRIRAPVRQVAEKYLLQRLPRLSMGEKINLARRAPPRIAAELGKDGSSAVLRALLGNPRLTEEVLLRWIGDLAVNTKALDLMARDERWGRRYEVRLAFCRNPKTPFRVLFELLPTLRRDDLELVSEVAEHSTLVLQRVQDLLDEATNSSASGEG